MQDRVSFGATMRGVEVSHKIVNGPTFWCPKCLHHKKNEFRSTLTAGRAKLSVCIPCSLAITKLLKERRKKK